MLLILVRHGLPVRVESAEGPADPPLSDIGELEARAVGRWLADEPIEAIVTSPMRRAVQTAAAIAAHHGMEPVQEPGFAEYDVQSSSYIPYEERKARRDPQFQALVRGRWEDVTPEGEGFKTRVLDALDSAIADNPGRTVAVVCHGGVINVCLAHVLRLQRDLFFEPAYTSISRIAASRSGIRSIVSINETAHLRHLERTRPKRMEHR